MTEKATTPTTKVARHEEPMSDSEDSAVLVEAEQEELLSELVAEDEDEDEASNTAAPAPPPGFGPLPPPGAPHACQIVSVVEKKDKESGGDDDDSEDEDDEEESGSYAFHFEKEKLAEIVARIPPNYKVSVVSVVGAFRTGKSFLLSWFLRYLHCAEQRSKANKSTGGGAGAGAGGDLIEEEPWYDSFSSIGNDGFDWRAGSERNTTGIWMWSHPHLIDNADTDDDPVAVLLVDTQGMFDHETTMKLTACIFGFSTLLSSYQIYNVDKRVQEDNLQQLALFSEYARAAVQSDEKKEKQQQLEQKKQPFQHIEFLVRDWQHFDTDEDYDESVDYAALQSSMEGYLDKVLSERQAKDLKDTREQIFSCFENVTCYGLCHPGFAVTKKKYGGDVKDLEPLFLQLLDRYCRKVFSPESLKPKTIHGRELYAQELFTYIEAYAALFASGSSFPTAATMLEATTSANNTNAVNLALDRYSEIMDRVAGPNCSNYMKPEELQEEHAMAREQCLDVFASIANFGNQTAIQEAREKVEAESDKNYVMYTALNEGRNPLSGLEIYLIPTVFGIVAFFMTWIADSTCSPYSEVCRAFSDFFSHTYAVLFSFLAIVAATKAEQVHKFLLRLKTAFDVMTVDAPATGGKAKKE